mmetsp:Transcript_2772/g.9769  ORF Transcript_2772/g.9769 Transcript_2772/m.9769 type:complete len:336 (-) Transcript_2772:2131-3138(-)
MAVERCGTSVFVGVVVVVVVEAKVGVARSRIVVPCVVAVVVAPRLVDGHVRALAVPFTARVHVLVVLFLLVVVVEVFALAAAATATAAAAAALLTRSLASLILVILILLAAAARSTHILQLVLCNVRAVGRLGRAGRANLVRQRAFEHVPHRRHARPQRRVRVASHPHRRARARQHRPTRAPARRVERRQVQRRGAAHERRRPSRRGWRAAEADAPGETRGPRPLARPRRRQAAGNRTPTQRACARPDAGAGDVCGARIRRGSGRAAASPTAAAATAATASAVVSAVGGTGLRGSRRGLRHRQRRRRVRLGEARRERDAQHGVVHNVRRLVAVRP